MITAELIEQVRELREQGHSWPQVSKIVGRPQRTCQRAFYDRPDCARQGCRRPALASGRFCTEHAKLAMRNKPGEGFRQREVMRLMRKHGMLTSERLRGMTGLRPDALGGILSRLVALGLLERPLQGHYRLAQKKGNDD